MKAVVNSGVLAKELKKLAPVIKKNTVLPILDCVKISFEKDKATLMATDLNTTVILESPCECKVPFVLIVEFNAFSDILAKINQSVTIELKDNEVLIHSDKGKFKFTKAGEDSEFPRIPDETFISTISVGDTFFSSLYNADQCKGDDLRPNMNGACIHLQKDSLSIVATDAHILYKDDFKIKTGLEKRLIIPNVFTQMVKQFSDAKLHISDKFVKAEEDGVVVISRLVDAVFVSYEVVLIPDIVYNLKTDRKDLITELSLVSTAANRATNLVSIEFLSDNCINIFSEDVDYGREGNTKINATHSVDFDRIGLNAAQAIKLLNLFTSEEVEFSFRSKEKSVFLRPAGEPATLCLIQPIFIK